MKLPVIRQFYRNVPADSLEKTLEALEAFCEFRGTTDEEIDVTGELITNICGALEVHSAVQAGTTEKDALNAFSQKVLGSIDR